MNTVLLTFCYFSFLMSLLYTPIVLTQNKSHMYYKVVVLLTIISCSILIGCWTFFQGTVPLLRHAHLWVISFPVDFVPGSLLYLYIKSILEKKKKFSPWDFLHFVPVVLHFIELIPFYLLPAEAKQHSLTLYLLYPERVSEHSVFRLPMNVHVFFKTAFWLFYIVLTIILLLRFRKKNPLWITRHNHIWFWITSLAGIHIIALLLCLGSVIVFNKYTYRQYSVMPPVFFILTCIILLMFKPKILYGLNHLSGNSSTSELKKEEENLSRTFELSPVKIEEYKEKIEALVHGEKAFLRKNYLLSDMSADLDIPLHHLSYVINKEFGTNYASFINNCRIEYIIQHRYDAAWSQFSLEGIGNEAGFNSRNTFFKAFKIVTGETPSEYFRKKEDNSSTL